MDLTTDLVEFATGRERLRAEHRATLRRSVARALSRLRQGEEDWAEALVRRVLSLTRERYRRETGRGSTSISRQEVAELEQGLRAALADTDPDAEHDIDRITTGLTGAIINTALYAAARTEEPDAFKTWVSMNDSRVRESHRALHSVTVPMGEKFEVGGASLAHPHDMSAPISEWANCRCWLAITPAVVASAAPSWEPGEQPEQGEVMDEDYTPWHALVAPKNVRSGDRRKFKELLSRELPLTLAYQRKNAKGHDEAVYVGRVDSFSYEEGPDGTDGAWWAEGVFLDTEHTDEAIYMIAEGGLRGVSVDADDWVMHYETDETIQAAEGASAEEVEQARQVEVYDTLRFSGLTIVAIPAFEQTYIALGQRGQEWVEVDDEGLELEEDDEIEVLVSSAADLTLIETAISEEPWSNFTQADYTDEQWYRATLIHLGEGESKFDKDKNKLPVYTPSGALSRAGVHAAASRIGQVDAPEEKVSAARARLRSLYRTLEEEPPQTLASGDLTFDAAQAIVDSYLAEFVSVAPGKTEDGPGWLTHPIPTDRLRDYWVRGPGRVKIGWGTPGDFRRCRVLVAPYVKPQHINGYCANRHYDALGKWPGPGRGRHSAQDMITATALVASAGVQSPPRSWFENPNLVEPTRLTVTDEGRVFGHIATWDTCHIGFPTECKTPPRSNTDYAYFNRIPLQTDSGVVHVGLLTYGTGHADIKKGLVAALAHYDNTGTAAAEVVAGEDDIGIWVAGAIRPGTPESMVRNLRLSDVSGDWRGVRGNAELCAVLACNVAGFPMPRPQVSYESQQVHALVAAGALPPREEPTPALDPQAIAEAVTAALEARGVIQPVEPEPFTDVNTPEPSEILAGLEARRMLRAIRR